MASFGKISNSLIQGTNENTFALANINFDFSLVSLAAPNEFTGLGTALAHNRRENAEHGALHRTARKLGALFESIVPQVPRLVSAYGKRASEIMNHPRLNPPGNAEKHGPFAAFVGADATSIWAAATSGGPSIAIHLLGCLLARSFSDPTKSISALFEIVHERRRQIRSESNTFASTATHMAALMAAEQPIERDELQHWDASARAWLQTADSAMKKDYIQLKLILQNISLPVTSASTLYNGVIRAWTQAMIGLERLLNGESQSVTDGAILLAISAWHLYPNLLVLGRESTNVDFGDHGVQSSGLLTVGITHVQSSGSGAKEGIYWSMALSHYRYYGKALNAMGEIDDRLTIDQLHLVAFGSLLSGWNVPRKDVQRAAKWVIALEGCLSRTKKSLGCPPWLAILAKAARDVTDIDSPRRQEDLALVHFGQRRGTNLLRPRSQSCLPWFGLRFSHIVDALAADTPRDCAVRYLRTIAKAGNLQYDEALITCITDTASYKHMSVHQYFTANTSSLRVDTQIADIHDTPDLEDDFGSAVSRDKGKAKTSDSWLRHNQELPGISTGSLSSHQSWYGIFAYPRSDIYRKGFAVHAARIHQEEPPTESRLMGGPNFMAFDEYYPLEQPMDLDPLLFGSPGLVGDSLPQALQYDEGPYDVVGGILVDCAASLHNGLGWFPSSPVRFQKFMGDPNGTIRLWLKVGGADTECNEFARNVQSLRSGSSAELLDIETSIRFLNEDGCLDPLLVWQYLDGADPYEPDSAIEEVLGLMRTEREQFAVTVKSLRSLEEATNIYNRLDGATISSSIVERGLYDVKWATSSRSPCVTRSMVFSCIAMMETGRISLDAQNLEQVFALSSGNSLFVSTRLLADPYDEVADSSVTRIVGNVGRPGVNLLIPPAASPLTRSLSNSFRAVTYAPFNGEREDNFKGTTLHLSFTTHKFPLDYGVAGIVDHQVFFVESVISIHDSGQWVGDLDTLEAFSISSEHRVRIPRRRHQNPCTHPEGMVNSTLDGITSLDTWEEVLDTNPGVNIIRAHKNWPARLAASVMLSKARNVGEHSDDADSEDLGTTVREDDHRNKRYSILENGDNVCWVCLHHRLSRTGKLSTADPFIIIS